MKNKYFFTLIAFSLIIFSTEGENLSDITSINLNKYLMSKEVQISDTIKEFIRYEPVEGKILGIWPQKETWLNVEKLKILKEKYGFTKILIRPYRGEFRRVITAGFDSANVWAYFFNKELINEIIGVETIYSDEPAHFFHNKGLQDKSPEEILQARNIIDTLNPKPDFVMGTYKWEKNLFGKWQIPDLFLREYSLYADGIMYTDYNCRCKSSAQEDKDQRPAWRQMRSLFGNKFANVWIGAQTDTLEYGKLFDEAASLGIKSVWFFQDLDPYKDFTNIARFCEIAWKKGWLKKVESVYISD